MIDLNIPLVEDQPLMIDFYADWCAPCQMLDPIFAEVQEQLSGKAQFLKIDIDKNPAIASYFDVKSVPTLLIIKNGKEEWRMAGFLFAKDLIKVVEKYI